MNKLFTYLITLSLFFGQYAFGQESNEIPAERLAKYKSEAKDLVMFIESTLNDIAGDDYTKREKSIIINETYLKYFESDKTQIEDDLDPNRQVVSNKDVQAYLKDVDFFFEEANFEFIVEKIEHSVNNEGNLYFTVQLTRKLDALTVMNDTISNSAERFVEINLDPDAQELKIASIYTTKLSQKEDMALWWNKLDDVWRNTVGADIKLDNNIPLSDVTSIIDSIMVTKNDSTLPLNENIFNHIEHFLQKKELDISLNPEIVTLAPLSKMRNLEDLNISGTGVNDLSPIRTLTNLKSLRCEMTGINSLDPLVYCTNLKVLMINDTQIEDITVVENFDQLKELYIFNTNISDLTPLTDLEELNVLWANDTKVADIKPLNSTKQLRSLDISNTEVTSIDALYGLKKLEQLSIDRTSINDLSSLATTSALKNLSADQSSISSLTPLSKLQNVERIYCDGTQINTSIAQSYMRSHPKTLVIYGSDQLKNWWESLSDVWQDKLLTTAGLTTSPEKEQLQIIANIKEIDIHNVGGIQNLDPLNFLINLEVLNAANTNINSIDALKSCPNISNLNIKGTNVTDISVLENHKLLSKLNIKGTNVSDLSPLEHAEKLSKIDISNSKVSSITPLKGLESLKVIEADNTTTAEAAFIKFAVESPAIIVFRTAKLQLWWEGLSDEWKEVLSTEAKIGNKNPDKFELHQINMISEINISNHKSINDLKPLQMLFDLKKLNISYTRITNLAPISGINTLEELSIDNTPISDITDIQNLNGLKSLNISNTLVEKFTVLEGFTQMEKLKVSGIVKVKNISYVTKMPNLKTFECYNTSINNLKYLVGLSNLKTLKCYKTKLNQKKVDAFKAQMPNVSVDYY
ncbi:leucine-rich repeat domain-containing protein [Flammeovirga sp. MY04]|uniref:leucine-rich repeat domain-containing protein n=1 Tax=Flammeovirga sp. MY04 TaxID=1191459 RepID=UPI000806233A|nr:leucine-rich repeat domain-containing protein [Flammeovirga sp. MY04]ANQ48265.1 leucine-rich repeat domain-containing protein [Flammeovirga sp. MY04]